MGVHGDLMVLFLAKGGGYAVIPCAGYYIIDTIIIRLGRGGYASPARCIHPITANSRLVNMPESSTKHRIQAKEYYRTWTVKREQIWLQN